MLDDHKGNRLVYFLLSLIIMLVAAAWADMSGNQGKLEAKVDSIYGELNAPDGLKARLKAVEIENAVREKLEAKYSNQGKGK